MKALVTGATGFIGSNLVRALLDDGAQVRGLARPGSDRQALEGLSVDIAEGDLLDVASLRRAVAGCDTLFHVAALYAYWPPDRDLFYRVNVEGTRNVLEAARDAGVQRTVFTSSSATIGPANGTRPASEEKLAKTGDLLKGYKESKYLAEQEAIKANAAGFPVVVVNPTAPMGPWDVKPTPTGRIVRDFLLGKMFGYVDTGLNVVHVRDVARGHILAAEKGTPGQRYILGNRNMALREIFQALGTIAGRRPPRLRVPYALALAFAHLDELVEGRMARRTPRATVAEVKLSRKPMYFDASRAVQELGMPQTSVEEALSDAVDWFRDHAHG